MTANRDSVIETLVQLECTGKIESFDLTVLQFMREGMNFGAAHEEAARVFDLGP